MMKYTNLLLLVILLGLLIALMVLPPAGCHGKSGGSELRTVRMKIGQRTFTLEVADTPASRERGLMFRESMPEDHGMIFVFPDESVRRFWMKNTRIPLDIIFVDASQQVVSIHPLRPLDLIGVSSGEPAKWAIELNRDVAGKAGVKVGDRLQIPAGARDTER
jgi:uncharacterized protein